MNRHHFVVPSGLSCGNNGDLNFEDLSSDFRAGEARIVEILFTRGLNDVSAYERVLGWLP